MHPARFRLEDYTATPPLPKRFEVVDGWVIESEPMSDYAAEVTHRLLKAVHRHLDRNDIGETGIGFSYHLPLPEDPGRIRRPRWSFVSYERSPKDRPCSYHAHAGDVVPDIAAEVVSPDDLADEVIAKVREYLRGGVRLVWVVYPLAREVHAYRPGAATVQVHFADADLDAPDVLPGFRTPVGPLFPPTA